MTHRKLPIAGIVTLALLTRLAISPWFHGFGYDMFIYGNWAETLVEHPLSSFYEHAESPDHLPGDLYIHLSLGYVFHWFGGENFYGSAYRYLLKAVPAFVDCLLVLLAYRFATSNATKGAGIQLSVKLVFAPALIFISAVWGQWDTVSMTIFLAGLLVLWSNTPRAVLAAILFGWALLIKPPLFLLVLPAVVGYAWTNWLKQRSIQSLLISLVGMVVAAGATITLLMWPFGMTWLEIFGAPSLQGQLQIAAELYPFTTLGAANIWMIPLGQPDRVSDSQTLLGLSFQTIGMAFFAITCIVVIFRVARSRFQSYILIWAMVMLSFGYFLLLTRSHERYLFPAVIMLAILAAMTEWRSQISALFLAVSMSYFINLVIVYATPSGTPGILIFESLSIANLALFVALLLIPTRMIRTTQTWLPAAARKAPESHPAA